MTFTELTDSSAKLRQQLLLKCRSGSHAYGLATPASDEDFRGVFFAPKVDFFGLRYPQQLSDATNDEVYYELGRFMELLGKANPTALELLATVGESRLFCHPVLANLHVEDFLSKACKNTFAGYAKTQIRKARGLNKKVHNPLPKQRKTIEQFCYVITEGKSLPLAKWVEKKKYAYSDLGLVNVDRTRGIYAVYHDTSTDWTRGITSGPSSNEVILSSVPKGQPCVAYLSFNQDTYSIYCREYREYWEWVEKRNDDRYEGTLAHGQGYDAKNMMHTIRLLDMAIDIFQEGKLNVVRPDRDFLLAIKSGNYSLAEVLSFAEDRLAKLDQLVEHSSLPDAVDLNFIEAKLVKMRRVLYGA